MALWRPRHVERALDREILSLESRHMEATRAHEEAGLLVGNEGVVIPAVPEQAAGFDEFPGHRVTLGMRRMLAAEHGARFRIGRRHHVPRRAAAREMIQRSEGAGHVIGLGVGRRGGSGEAEPRRAHRQRREQAERFELADGRRVLAVARGETVAQEEHVEFRRLGRGGDVLHQRQVGRARIGVGMAPAADVMARRLHEDTEAQLAGRWLHGRQALRAAYPTTPDASTAKSTVTVPAFSKTRVTGSVAPATRGAVRPSISR